MHHQHPHTQPQTGQETQATTPCPPATAEAVVVEVAKSEPPIAPATPGSPPVTEAQAAQAQPAEANQTASPTPPPPPPPSLEEQLREAQQKATEHHDAWLRAKAEGENIRRRAQDDISKAHKFAVERFAGDLLAVKDSLEAALTNQNQSAESLHAGVELTLKQLVSAFEKSGLKEINPAGNKFDPHFHQAIGMVEAEQEANTVVTVLQKGYLIAERVLRPALVMVAKAKPVAPPAPEASATAAPPQTEPPTA